MAHYSLLNNDDRGDIETFLAANVQCDYCHGEAVVRLMDAIQSPKESTQHARGCRDKSLVRIVKLDWYYAFGSEDFNWVDEPEGPYPTEKAAQEAAAEKVAELPPITPLPDGVVRAVKTEFAALRGVLGLRDEPRPTAARPRRPASYHEALGALDAIQQKVDRLIVRLNALDVAVRNGAYTLEFLAHALPEGWRRDCAATQGEKLRATIREGM